MNGLNTVRKIGLLRNSIGLILLGIIFTVLGILGILAPKSEMLETEATIVKIDEYYENINGENERCYNVFVDYEVNGVRYEGVEYGAYDSSMDVGDRITIEYSADDPSLIQSPGADIIIYVVAVLGVILLAAGVLSLVKNIKTRAKDLNEYDKVDTTKISKDELDSIRNNDEPKKKYFFHFAGKLNQSYVLEDEAGRIVYEARCEKMTAFKPFIFDFVNHITMHSETKEIGHTVSKSIGTGGSFSYSVPISSAFTVDGVNNWDYLASKGYGFEFMLKNTITPCFDVKHYGVHVAYIETVGTNKLRGKDSLIGKLPVNGLFSLECGDSELDGVFMTCFSISRAIFYENN